MRFAVISLVLCSLMSANLFAKSPSKKKPAKANAKQVELFAAMKSGDVVVKVIPKDATKANVMIENKSGQPLQIKLPAAFAAVPVLAQFGGGGMGGMGGGGMGGMGGGGMGGMGGGGMQGMGGGMGGMGGGGMGGMGGGGMGGMGGGGMFNVAPDAVGKIKATTVCLEHGKKDPNPRVAYELKPIDSFTKNPRVQEVCRMVGNRELTQEVAQVIAWHYTDDLSWQELANKIKIKHLNGSVEYFFTRQQVMVASRVAASIEQRIPEAKPEESLSPGEQLTVNN